MTFYLKYRPQKVEELDLEAVREQLTTVLKSKRLPHAFLFTGPRGLGKTSAARILAKAINCEQKKKGKAFEPCNRCLACRSITLGSALDVIEIDGASNRGIDDIRQLREQIKLSPGQLKKKIYIIDEVHMLTKEAFNALLKTLEEPPDHAFFILATTEPEKVPSTIVSRCFLISFKRPAGQEIERSLKRVIKAEKLKIDEEVLGKIARRADGSFRDGVKILEQLSLSGKKITAKLFEEALGKTWEADFLKALEEKDAQKALEWIGEANKSGIDWKNFLQTVLYKLRDYLLVFYGIGEEGEVGFSQEELKLLIKLFSQAGASLRTTPILHLPIELAIVEYCQKTKTDSFPIDKSQKTTAGSVIGLKQIKDRWEEVLKRVKPQNHSVEALLRGARPKEINGKKVVIEVFYQFHKGRLETDKCRRIIEDSLKQVFGRELFTDYVLGEKTNLKSKDKDEELVKAAEEIFIN